MSIVRASRLYFKHANHGKLSILQAFLAEYRLVVQKTIDHVWSNRLLIGDRVLDVQNNDFYLPSFIPNNCCPEMETILSGRAVKCATTQAVAMVKAALKRRAKDLSWLSKLKGAPLPKTLVKRLERPLVKPSADHVKAELNSICATLTWGDETSFDGWLVLSSLGKAFGKINIPLNKNRHFNRLSRGRQLASFLISADGVDVRFAIEPETHMEASRVVGGDTGLRTVLTLSDGQTTPECDRHGHSFQSICHGLARKKKGSKSFSKAQAHRKNFIHWSLNQLNLSSITEIRLEKVRNINYGRRTPRHMQAWANADIQRKVMALAEEQNVSVKLQSSIYRSQRCSVCGLVRKANRKGKIYSCKGCGFVCDADLNASRNHEQNLPPVPDAFYMTKRNLGAGFYWTSDGCSSSSGVELAVPSSKKTKPDLYSLSQKATAEFSNAL